MKGIVGFFAVIGVAAMLALSNIGFIVLYQSYMNHKTTSDFISLMQVEDGQRGRDVRVRK